MDLVLVFFGSLDGNHNGDDGHDDDAHDADAHNANADR